MSKRQPDWITALSNLEVGPRGVAHRLISARLRQQILKGKIPPGTELPATGALATLWNTSKTTTHTALSTLVKEGLLERRHGSGTFVRESPQRLERVGIYTGDADFWSAEGLIFARVVYDLVQRKLVEEGIEPLIFSDSRRERQQRTVWRPLREAVESRAIQGLIVPTANSVNLRGLLNLQVPVAVVTGAIGVSSKVSNPPVLNHFRPVFEHLARRGCRSVGLITPQTGPHGSYYRSESLFVFDDFQREAARHGMLTRTEWLLARNTAAEQHRRPREYGYQAFHQLWREKRRPDAVVAMPDQVVHGVIMAALELGAHVGGEIEFCFQRNKTSGVPCPFPAFWSTVDEEQAAGALIGIVKQLHAGQQVSPVSIPYTFAWEERTIEACPAAGRFKGATMLPAQAGA